MAIRPEIELLLYCVRMHMGTGCNESFERLVRSPHLVWPELIHTALQHSMLPLLAHHLSPAYEDAVPATEMARLQAQRQTLAQQNLFQTEILLTLLDVFSQYDIPALPYRGPVLSTTLYDDLALRPFCGLDVIVRKRDVALAKALLIDQWFRPWKLLTATQEKRHLRQQCTYRLVSDADQISVDLHWGAAPDYSAISLDSDTFWSRLQTVDLCGQAVESLSADDLLLMLCIHGARGHWRRLSWLCDVALLLNAYPELDWTSLLQTARQINCERIFLLGLRLAAELMAAPLPAEMVPLVRANGPVGILATQICRRLGSVPELPSEWIEREWLDYPRMRERWRDRVPYLIHLLSQSARLKTQDKPLIPAPAY